MQTVIQTSLFGDSVEMPSAKLEPPVPSSAEVRRRAINARYELAERSVELNEQFARAQGGSGKTVADQLDRSTIRDRVRHEMLEADPWMNGSHRTTVVSVIGRGPWLEVKIPGDPENSKLIADKFNYWFRTLVHGPRKFRTMCWGQGPEGTGLAIMLNDPSVRGDVKLNFLPIEDDQIKANPGTAATYLDRARYLLDGKEYDDAGNPSLYHICERHPDEYPDEKSKPVRAQYVLDIWEQMRPSQGRAISNYVTSAKNGPLRRTYRRAVMDAAATAAKISFLMKTNIDRFENGDEAFEDMDALTGLPLYYGEGMALPKGWEGQQLKAEQPTTGHDEFIRSNVAEMGRPTGQPGMVTLNDAKGQNFAGGSLGRADWADDVDVRRQDWETLGLDKLLSEWLWEAARVGLIPREYENFDDVPHEYRWTRRRHQDTNKEYSGRAKAIATGQTSRAFWQTDDGLNPDAEDQSAADGFGVSLEEYRRAVFAETFPTYHQAQTAQQQGGDNDPKNNGATSKTNGVDSKTKKAIDAIFAERLLDAAFEPDEDRVDN